MSIGGLIFFLLLLAGCALLIGVPLLRRESRTTTDALHIEKQRERLMAYYERVLTFLREYQPPAIRFHLDPQYFLAFWRSIVQLGIRGVERVYYWRLFFWTLFRRPRLFPLAITLAIMGFHFRQVTELHVG